MRQDLDTLRAEIEQALEEGAFVVFHGYPRDPGTVIRWNTETCPDPKLFLRAAKKLDVRLIVFSHMTFTRQMLEQAADELETTDIPREEYREMERRIEKFRGYEGFTCSLEMSFDLGNDVYLYEARTPWYNEFLSLLDEIEDLADIGVGEEDDSGPLGGGYYSHN